MDSHLFLTILLSIAHSTIPQGSSSSNTKCNGIKELCDLDITQVTLAGSHNSGSGFDGILNYHSGIGKTMASSCWFRNQEMSFDEQLEFGIRYFDIDACWENWYEPNSAYICHGDAYAGPISKMLNQIDDWMNKPKNRNEVIVINFNRDYAKKNKDDTGRAIIGMLENKWDPATKRPGELKMQKRLNAKLRDSVNANKRIYVIIHKGLRNSMNRPWLFDEETYVGLTWVSHTWVTSNGCWNLVNLMGKTRCKKEARTHSPGFVRYDLYLSSGLCIDDLAWWCNSRLTPGLKKCFSGTENIDRTVNFLVVDYVDQNLVDETKAQNIRNVKLFLNKNISP